MLVKNRFPIPRGSLAEFTKRITNDFKARLVRFSQLKMNPNLIYMYLLLDFAELTRIGYTLGFLQVCWVNACRDSNIYRIGVRALWDLNVTLRPLHAVPQKALSSPLMSGQWGDYSSPSSWQANDGWGSSDWNNGGKKYGSGQNKSKNKNNGGDGDEYRSGSANSITTQQIMGTLGTIVREKIQAKEKQTALQHLREALPAELSGLITPAIQQHQQQQASSCPPSSSMQHSSDMGSQYQNQSWPPSTQPFQGRVEPHRYSRPWDVAPRCAICGSKEHWATICPTNPERPTGRAPLGGPPLQQQPQQQQQQQQAPSEEAHVAQHLLNRMVGAASELAPPPPPMHEPNCFKCLKAGHWAKDCPENQQTGGLTQVRFDSFFENSRHVRNINRSVEETKSEQIRQGSQMKDMQGQIQKVGGRLDTFASNADSQLKDIKRLLTGGNTRKNRSKSTTTTPTTMKEKRICR